MNADFEAYLVAGRLVNLQRLNSARQVLPVPCVGIFSFTSFKLQESDRFMFCVWVAEVAPAEVCWVCERDDFRRWPCEVSFQKV